MANIWSKQCYWFNVYRKKFSIFNFFN